MGTAARPRCVRAILSDPDAAVALSMLLVAVAAVVVAGLGARRLGGSGAG